MAGTLFDGVQTLFEIVHLRVQLAVDALGLGIQLVLRFDLIF